MGRKISVKQQKFIDAYIELGNATEAAKRAGYKCRSAHAYESLGAENVRKLEPFINERMKELKQARIADLNEVLEFLSSVLRGEITEIVFNPSDGAKEEVRANVRSRVDAARELLKRYPSKLDEERQKLLTETRQEITDLAVQAARKVLVSQEETYDQFLKKAETDESRDETHE